MGNRDQQVLQETEVLPEQLEVLAQLGIKDLQDQLDQLDNLEQLVVVVS